MKSVAITGASGFIGSALSVALRASGVTVRPFVRPGRSAEGGIAWDPESGTIDRTALEGIDAIVHLAGENIASGRWTEAQKTRIRDSRLRGTSLLARTLVGLSRKPRVWLSASAVGFYGNRGDELLDESSAPGTDFLAKLAIDWENAAREAQGAIRIVHPRIGLVLDPSGGPLRTMVTPFKLGVGGRIGSGKQFMSWISLRDALRAIEFLLRTDTLEGAFNLTSETPVTNAEFSRALGRALHRPAVLPLPALAARALLGEMAEGALLSGARVLPKRLVDAGFRFEDSELAAFLAKVLRPE